MQYERVIKIDKDSHETLKIIELNYLKYIH